jgi:hypothetical protein
MFINLIEAFEKFIVISELIHSPIVLEKRIQFIVLYPLLCGIVAFAGTSSPTNR